MDGVDSSARANVHIALDDGGPILIVESTEDFLRAKSYFYLNVQVRLSAEQNTRTGRLRKARLMARAPGRT